MDNNQWYQKDGDVHQDVFSIVRSIQNNQGLIRRNIQRNIRLYGSTMQTNFGSTSYVTIDDFSDKMNINVVSSLVDTVYNKISKNKPRIQFLTEAGSWENQQTAKKLNKFIDGQFYATKIYEQMPIAFRDALVSGSGFIKIYKDGKDIKSERVFTGELIADELEGIYGNPTTIYQIKLIPKSIVAEMFPDKKHLLMSTQSYMYTTGTARVSDNIWVIEAWKLPTNELKNNGKHVICADNVTLLKEEYNKPYFPFVKLDYKKRILGYMGSSIVDEIYPIQLEITRVCRKIQQVFHLLGVPRVYLEYASEVIKAQLTNEIGSVVYYQGQPPIIAPPNVLDPQLFQYLQYLIQTVYENTGVSALSAQSKKPAGLNSGKALREYSDIESERFYKIGEGYENAFIDAAKIMIDYAKDIEKEYGNYSVMAKTNESFELIKWKDVNLKESEYVMQPYPTSFFSKTPSGQLQDAVDMVQAGMIDTKTAMRIFDFPDVKEVTKYLNAPQELIHKLIDEMVYKNTYHSPEPFMDLDYGLKYCQTVYNYSKMSDVPEDRLELLRTWMTAAKNLVDMAIQEQQQMQMDQQAQMQQAQLPQAPQVV